VLLIRTREPSEKVLLVAGSVNMAGAAVLAAKAAYRSGCGLVRIYTPEEKPYYLTDSSAGGNSYYLFCKKG